MRLTPDQDGHAPLGYHVNREVNMFFVAAEETETGKQIFTNQIQTGNSLNTQQLNIISGTQSSLVLLKF